MDLIKEKMSTFKCPFTWNMDKIGDYDRERTIKTSIEELSNEFNEESPIRMFVRYVILMYESSRISGKIEEMKEDMIKYRKKATNLFDYEPMKSYENVFRHVLLSTEAFALLRTNNTADLDNLNQIINEIPEIDEKDEISAAAICGLKGTLLTICHTPLIETLVCDCARKAIQLDPHQAEWHFLLGKQLSRIRRRVSRHELPTKEELAELEMAAKLSNSPMHLVFLGQSYGEMVSVLNRKNGRNPDCLVSERYHNTAQKCLQILGKLSRNHEEWYIQLRCGIAYMELPHPYTRLHLSQKCFSKAEAGNGENEFLCHQYSRLFAKLHDWESARYYSKKAALKGVFGAQMDYIRYSMRVCKNFDVIGEIDENIHRYSGEDFCTLLCTKGAYYFFKARNVEEGVRFILYALKVPIAKDFVFRKFSPPFEVSCMRSEHQFSVYNLLFDLIAKLKKSNKCNVKSSEEMKEIAEIEEILNSRAPELSRTNKYSPFYSNMVNVILKGGDSVGDDDGADYGDGFWYPPVRRY